MEIKIKNHKFIFTHERINHNASSEASFDDNTLNYEDLKNNLDRINFWLGNVDQKAGILLAIEGVILTIACTSDAVCKIVPIIKNGCTDLSFYSCNTWIAIFSILALLSTLTSIYILLRVISATIDPKKFAKKNPNLVTNSMLHFETIQLRSYEMFRSEEQNDKQKRNDIRSQIYINSIICTRKFNSYKYALIAFKLMILFITIVLILAQF